MFDLHEFVFVDITRADDSVATMHFITKAQSKKALGRLVVARAEADLNRAALAAVDDTVFVNVGSVIMTKADAVVLVEKTLADHETAAAGYSREASIEEIQKEIDKTAQAWGNNYVKSWQIVDEAVYRSRARIAAEALPTERTK